MSKEKIEKREFITLHVEQTGFLVYTMGPGTSMCMFYKQPLDKYLDRLRKKMFDIKCRLNTLWDLMDKENPDHPCTVKLVELCLKTGWWALSLAMELEPFQERCRYGSTNPLRFLFIRHLEEVFTKCFTTAWIFGNTEQQAIGLRGLITDFQSNGGVHLVTGEPGNGLRTTLFSHYNAHFAPNDREKFVYEKFLDLMVTLATIVEEQHPKCRIEFARAISFMIQNHFGQKDITSPAKTVMLQRLVSLANHLDPVNPPATLEAEVVAKK